MDDPSLNLDLELHENQLTSYQIPPHAHRKESEDET